MSMSSARVQWPDVAFLHPISELPNCDSMEWCNGTGATTGPRVLVVVWCCCQQSANGTTTPRTGSLYCTPSSVPSVDLDWEGLVTADRCRDTPNIEIKDFLVALHEPILYWLLHEYCLLLGPVQLELCGMFITSILIKHQKRMIGKWIKWLNVTDS